MAIAVESSGTQTATISTEHTLAAPTTAKTRILKVDLSAMLASDVVELRIKTKILTGGAVGLEGLAATYSGPQSGIVASVPVADDFGATFTLKQTAGTGRAFPWKVLTLD